MAHMQFTAKKLTKSRKNVRMAIFGPTGSGKTYTSLAIARGLVDEEILIIDSERKTAGLYAEDLNYDGRVQVIDDLPSYSPEVYTAALEYAAAQGFKCVIIDSLSHAWEGALDEVDKAAQRSKSGNSFAAWKEVTPMHNKMVDTILRFPGHVIVTMRVKTEWVMDEVNGKKVPRKVGLQPRQKDGIEYEFDFTASMDQENNFVMDKTRATAFTGFVEKRPGADLAARLRAWAEAGGEPDEGMTDPHLALKAFNVEQAQIQRLRERTKAKGWPFSEVVLSAWNMGSRGASGLEAFIDRLESRAEETLQPKPEETVAKEAPKGDNAGTPESTPPADNTPPMDKGAPGDTPRFGLDANQKMVFGRICDKNGWQADSVMQACWDDGLRTFDDLLKRCAEMANTEIEAAKAAEQGAPMQPAGSLLAAALEGEQPAGEEPAAKAKPGKGTKPTDKVGA